MSAVTAVTQPPVWSHTRRGWNDVVAAASQLAGTIDAYLAELAKTLTPASVQAAETTLRHFAGRVLAIDPHCRTVASITERHVQDYTEWFAHRVDPTTGRTVSSNTVNYRLAQLRLFFERIDRWGYTDSPASIPVPPRHGRQPRPVPSRPPARRRVSKITDAVVTPAPTRSRSPRRSRSVADDVVASSRGGPDSTWDEIIERAPQMAATMTAYLEQLAVSSRPSTVVSTAQVLRQFAAHVTRTDPACTSVAAVERRHIETYKIVLAARPGRRHNVTLSSTTIRINLGMLRTFFERVIDYDYPDAPRRVPVFAGDLPKADEPLPRSLDDPTAAKFMAALATDPNRRRRLMVELLARTGMRVGELGALQDDAMHRHGDTWWLRIPIGKLHNDRTVPLHPMLVELIHDYQQWRGPSTTGLLVERDDHQPFDRRTIHRYVVAAARRAGVGHVHPHQLRHTLATQCINRGMSLEAIAALLGHRTPRMTLVYARIADTNVAEQYFNATRAVETTTAPTIPTTAAGDTRDNVNRRLLGNGHCTRPLELDCRFQTICEGCGFYETTPSFLDILRRQRDDAQDHHDTARAELYNQLVNVIDDH